MLQTTLQWNKSKRTVTLKCKRAVLDATIELWAAFFGAPLEMSAPTTPAKVSALVAPSKAPSPFKISFDL